MSELSPAAFAVVHAFVCAHARKSDPSSNVDIAAALRAAADQLVIKLGGLGQESAWYLEEIANKLEVQ